MRPSLASGLIYLALLGAACTQDRRAQEQASVEPQPASVSDSPWATFASSPWGYGLEPVEASEDGRVIAGHRRPVPPQSSARLVFDAALYEPSGVRVALAQVGGLLDARFAPSPSKTIALLDERQVLWVWTPGRPPQRVDEGVFQGFAFSRSGRFLMASKGLEPELDVWRYDLEDGDAKQLTFFHAPAWGFAFSPDDTRVLFVGSQEGFPSLFSIAVDGTRLAKLTNRGMKEADLRAGARLAPFPDSRRPPQWTASAVYVQDSEGVHVIDFQGRVVLSVHGASGLHRSAGAVFFSEGDHVRRLP
jgi:hypothetical protein